MQKLLQNILHSYTQNRHNYQIRFHLIFDASMVINIDHFTFIKSNYICDELKVHVCIIFIK